MRHRKGNDKLGRPVAHRLALLRNLATDLIRHERLVTTEARARALRPFAERLITLGKNGTLHARRQALATVFDPAMVDKLFHVVAARFRGRAGGYTRLVRVGHRRGDGAPLVQIQIIES